MFYYTAQWGKRSGRSSSGQGLVRPTIRALARVDNDLDTLWCYERRRWHILTRVTSPLNRRRACGHFTARIPHLELHRC